jgi:hypothetical protein
MKRYEKMRDLLRSGKEKFVRLDGAQLVKHAFGLVTEARRRSRRPGLFYIFAEPSARNDSIIAPEELLRHRDEVARFGKAVAGDEVAFRSTSYREWLASWQVRDPEIAAHRNAIVNAFSP